MHLRYCMYEKENHKTKEKHPQLVMKELGIEYQVSTPQSMGNQWWFWNCENVQNELPLFLTTLDKDPLLCVGNGLGPDEAIRIRLKQEELEKEYVKCSSCIKQVKRNTKHNGFIFCDECKNKLKPPLKEKEIIVCKTCKGLGYIVVQSVHQPCICSPMYNKQKDNK